MRAAPIDRRLSWIRHQQLGVLLPKVLARRRSRRKARR